jgi:hypothetical protein
VVVGGSLPVFGGRHVVPGLERRRKRADVRIAQQHRYLERFQARIAKVVDRQFGAHFFKDLLETGLFGLEAALQRSATQLECPASGVSVRFAARHQISELAF